MFICCHSLISQCKPEDLSLPHRAPSSSNKWKNSQQEHNKHMKNCPNDKSLSHIKAPLINRWWQMRRDFWYSSLTISPMTNPSLLPVTGEPPHNYPHIHIHCAPNHQSLLPVFRSWSDTENLYASDRSILTLSPIEVTHCWLPGLLTVKHRRATMNCNHPPNHFINLSVSSAGGRWSCPVAWNQRTLLSATGHFTLKTWFLKKTESKISSLWSKSNCLSSQLVMKQTSVELLLIPKQIPADVSPGLIPRPWQPPRSEQLHKLSYLLFIFIFFHFFATGSKMTLNTFRMESSLWPGLCDFS